MCKNSIWDLINSTINRRAERDVQTTGGMKGMCKRLLFFLCLCNWVCVKEPDGLREEAPPQSLTLCHHAPEALARCQIHVLSVWVPTHSEEWVICSSELLVGRASTAPLTIEGHLWACRSLLSVWVPSHSAEWILRFPELLVGRANTAPLTIEGHLWACRTLLSVWVPSHSEEWVLCSPELCDRSLSLLVKLALLPSP